MTGAFMVSGSIFQEVSLNILIFYENFRMTFVEEFILSRKGSNPSIIKISLKISKFFLFFNLVPFMWYAWHPLCGTLCSLSKTTGNIGKPVISQFFQGVWRVTGVFRTLSNVSDGAFCETS